MTSTMHYVLESSFKATPPQDAPPEAFSDFIDAVIDHLTDLKTEDLWVVANDADRTFTISLLLHAPVGESAETTMGRGLGTIRTAFHVCQASTPKWPDPDQAKLLGVNLTLTFLPDEPLAFDVAEAPESSELANA